MRWQPIGEPRCAWHGSLMEGSGTIVSTTSGAFGGAGGDLDARAEDEPGGKTSPEELIAAAHAACFSMALSAGLAKAGTAAGGAPDVRDRHLPAGRGHHADRAHGRGHASPASTRDAFEQAAQAAKENCPVSKALAGVPEITLEARLGVTYPPAAWPTDFEQL